MTNRWLLFLGTVAAGVCVAVGTGPGIAVAEPSPIGGSSTSTDQSGQPTGGVEDAAAQQDSPTTPQTRGTALTARDSTDPPESTVRASTVTVRGDGPGTPRESPTPIEDALAGTDADAPDGADVAQGADAADGAGGADGAAKLARGSVAASQPQRVALARERPQTLARPAAPAETTPAGTDEKPTGSAVVGQAGTAPGPTAAPPTAAEAPPESTAARVAVASATAAVATGTPTAPTVLNIVGTLLFTVVTLPLKLFEQAPVIPPGSSVTVGRSTLDIDCGCGQTVDARWYFPNQVEKPRSVVYLQHGFLRSNSALSAMAIQLAEGTNSVVVAPTLSSNPFAADGCNLNGEPMQRAVANLFVAEGGAQTALTQSAIDAGWTEGVLPEKFVLSGHSAGGGLAAAAAGFTVDNRTVSDLLLVVMFDGVPTGDSLPIAVAKLSGANYREVYQIAAPPYSWNADGLGSRQLEQARPGQFVGFELVGGSHIDSEGASSDILARLATGFPLPQNVAAAQALAIGWINDALRAPGTPRQGIYGAPGEIVVIPTSAGNATAVALGTSAAGTRPVV